MRSIRFAVIISAVAIFLFSCHPGKRSGKPRVLVFTKTMGFRHSSIPNGIAAIQKLGKENGFEVDSTEDATIFNEDSLKHYSAVVFLHTTGDILDAYQQADFERYIQAGGGYMGIHAAADCEYQWPWYGKLVGAYFKSHPRQQTAKFMVKDKTNPATKHLPDVWERKDELYNFRKAPSDSDVKVLLTIDEKSYEGGENGDRHPMAWYHDYDGGRAFYTELGHTEESYTEENYIKHILGGIQYAIGDNRELDYSKATSMRVPDEDRFTKNLLATGFDEPTEMAILPNLDIVIVQRKGEVMFYNHDSKQLSQVAKLDVYYHTKTTNANAEEGLLGVCADPDYANNKFIYMFYSPGDTSVNRLSRFRFDNGKLDSASEKIVLQFYSQREICCHTGGSLTFGPNGNLFLSTGDNSTPFNQPKSVFQNNGYAPQDNRTGFEQYDARRSSSNTNDLRGKILRIKINSDGSYSIPEGNLFKPGTEKTRPEIFVMGDRNPYRISVDKKTGFLYWGEVGPDAGEDSLATRGPRGYDELNQARKAGYFGWPLFVGNNYPYHQYDYSTGTTGPNYDPQHPINDSKNNTGLRELPPVSPAFIWYPYAASPDFPELGTGGRNAMAGPIYHPEFYPADTRFPDYFANKLFFYEWIRGWIKIVTMDDQGNLLKMEPFMPHTELHSNIDMEMGPDGRLYLLEYGSGWFSKNPDAMLSRVEYNGGNRAPVAKLSVDRTTGALPFEVKASAAGSRDSDKDPLTYVWHFGKETKETKTPEASFTFTTAGDNDIFVEVKDDKGAVTRSNAIPIYAGNETPVVKISLASPATFFFPGKPIDYKVSVTDKEDGTTESGGVDKKTVDVKMDLVTGKDKAQIVGHQIVSALTQGKNMAMSMDCKTCHKQDEKSIGPAFSQVAVKYKGKNNARDYLVRKIILGGGGVWGETAMAAHPNLKPEDAGRIVDWVLSLSTPPTAKSLASEGKLVASANDAAGGKTMQISASYTDKGGAGAKPLTGADLITLRNPLVPMSDNNGTEKISVVEFNDKDYAVLGSGDAGWMLFDDLNLKYVTGVELAYGIQEPLLKGYLIEVHADTPDGELLGQGKIPAGGKAVQMNKVAFPLKSAGERNRKIYLVVKKADPAETKMMGMGSIQFMAK